MKQRKFFERSPFIELFHPNGLLRGTGGDSSEADKFLFLEFWISGGLDVVPFEPYRILGGFRLDQSFVTVKFKNSPLF